MHLNMYKHPMYLQYQILDEVTHIKSCQIESAFIPMTRIIFGRGLAGSNTSYSSISSAVSERSVSLSIEN